MFTEWYQKAKYECWGFTAPKLTEEVKQDLLDEYYQTFLIPLTYIASKSTLTWNRFKKALPAINEDIEDTLYSLCKVQVNELFTYFNALSVGLAWIIELPSFMRVYVYDQKLTVKECLYKSWDVYMKTHNLRLGWFGILGEEFAKDVFVISAKPLLYYEDGETYNGGTKIASLKGIQFSSYDTNRIDLARKVLQVLPEFIKWIPTATVERISNGNNEMVDNVPVTDLNTNGYPPIEAIQLYDVIPNAEKVVHKTFTATINYHQAVGAVTPEPVSKWLKSSHVLDYLNKHYKVDTEEPNVDKVTLQPNVILPPKKTSTTSLPVKEESLKPEVVEKKDDKNAEIEDLKKRLNDAIVSRIELETKVTELKEKLADTTIQDELTRVKEELQMYKEKEENNTDVTKLLNTQIESLKNEVSELNAYIKRITRYDSDLFASDSVYRAQLRAFYLLRKNIDTMDAKDNNLNSTYFIHLLCTLLSMKTYNGMDTLLQTIENMKEPVLLEYMRLCSELSSYVRTSL